MCVSVCIRLYGGGACVSMGVWVYGCVCVCGYVSLSLCVCVCVCVSIWVNLYGGVVSVSACVCPVLETDTFEFGVWCKNSGAPRD